MTRERPVTQADLDALWLEPADIAANDNEFTSVDASFVTWGLTLGLIVAAVLLIAKGFFG